MKGNETRKFATGELVATRAIVSECDENKQFAKEVAEAFTRYCACDWGEMVPADAEMNDRAIETGDDRIFARYETSVKAIYIITDWDRKHTTILFCNEY